MKSYLPIAALVSLALLATACGPAAEQPVAEAAQQAQDVAAIKALSDDYIAALNAGDAAALADLFTEDAILMGVDAPAAIGKETIQSGMQAFFDQFTSKLTGSTEEVEVAGDWAFSRDSYTGTLTPKAGGEPTELKLKGLTVYKRQPDGSWKYYRAIANSDLP
jgi:uncharacterized protein (TIGR02246 family)